MKKYIYEVRPVKPTRLPNGKITRRAVSLPLTTDQVKELMKTAHIYRRFPDLLSVVRVTMSNLEELHRERFHVVKNIVEEIINDVEEIITGKKPEKEEQMDEIETVDEDADVEYTQDFEDEESEPEFVDVEKEEKTKTYDKVDKKNYAKFEEMGKQQSGKHGIVNNQKKNK